jgi:NHL repeat
MMSALKVIRFGIVAGGLAVAIGVGNWGLTLQAQNSGAEALQKANVAERLVERTPGPRAGTAPRFVLDPAWPKILPHNWQVGEIAGIFVDTHNHIWVIHRPRALDAIDAGALGVAGKNEKGESVDALGHPRDSRNSQCCVPAPSVLEFDQDGGIIQAWGGPADPGYIGTKCKEADGCYWPGREHGIFVDDQDNVWLTGNGEIRRGTNGGAYPWAANFGGNDSQILKFRSDGTFIMAIGTQGMTKPNSNDTAGGLKGTPQPYLAADVTVDPKSNVAYLADGYGNRRVLMVDATTGKYIGHFGAYGQNPVVGESTEAAYGGQFAEQWKQDHTLRPKFFRNPVHYVKLSDDGFLYVADRGNNRVQVFRTSDVGKPCANPQGEAGKCGFVKEVYVAPQTPTGTSGSVTFSTDPGQTCLYVGDLNNDQVYILNRENLTELGRVGSGGRQAGTFHWPHTLTVDQQGNLYVGEVDGNGRLQRFLRYGPQGCSGMGNPNVGEFIDN